MNICTGVATTIIPDLLRKAWEELQYLCKHKSYVQDFKKEEEDLLSALQSVKLEIEEAKKRNKTRVDPMVEHWLESANELLQQDTKPAKCFGLCTNCCSQIAQAKELEKLMKERIPKMIAKVKEFPKEVARAAGVPGMEFHSQEFMPFESRKKKFEELKKELGDENKYMIGLQGPGGTGKSTMAIEVGKQVEKSKLFDKVIFTNVSTPVDEKRIRDDIAKQLELQLEEEMPMSPAQQIWTRIAHVGKVLIILDDIWEELDLKNMGIQPRFDVKGYCCVLLTTRSSIVCNNMGCQRTIQLDVLPMDDALNLFLSHTTASGNDCPGDLKKLAQDIMNECGGLPILIVAVAKALKSLSLQQWQAALITLKNPMPSRHGIVDEDKRKIYNSLRLSYDHLKDEEAKILFLLCSMFPKAYEIPLELLSRIAIGLGLFGERDQYYVARSHANEIENALINSSLLLKAGEVYVRMHDVIREMALEKIDNEKIQVITDSKTKLKENVMYSSWIISGFPNCSDDSKVKVLFVWINANGSLEVPNTVFGAMKSLRVLLLNSKIEFGRTPAQSLPKSIQSLKHIRTLSLTNLELDDISMLMRSLEKLESLELTNCSITEVPNGISELDKLRFLSLIRCSLQKNNPFEVIARCSQVEELCYVSNEDHTPIGAKVPQITNPPDYQTFHIDGSDFSAFDSSQLDASIKKCFKPARLQTMFSDEVIKYLAARAEILDLRGDDKTGWSNLIPDIVSIEDDGAMKDLIKLSLKRWSKMKCLIYTKNLQLKSGVTIFSKLIELQLDGVDVREICCGRYPNGFLKQLEKLELTRCQKLESTLFKGKLDLGNLNSIEINSCSMTCLFHPSTAQSPENLEKLKIAVCSKLEYIISDEGSSTAKEVDDKDPNPRRSHDSMFPKLKLLHVYKCEELEFILPTCFCEDLPLLEGVEISLCENLKYMFGQYSKEGGLHQMQKENALPSLKVMSIEEVPSFVNIYQECYLPEKSVANTSEGSEDCKDKSPSSNVSWGPLCCFLPKSETANKDESCTSKTAQLNHTTSQNKYVGNRAHGIFTPPLYPCYLREMNIGGISNLRSLFSVSVASSMSLLEKLTVRRCDELEHIVMEEVDGHDHMNGRFFFLNLRTIEIFSCRKLESLFPASCSTKLVHLESVDIRGARELEYVFGKSCGDDKLRQQNQNCEIHLPALEKLSLEEVPNMVNMCPENYYVKASSLEDVILGECPQLPINSFIDVSVEGHRGQEQVSRKKVIGMCLCNLRHLSLKWLDMETIYDMERLQIACPVNSSLKTLILRRLNKLRNICVGPKNHLSFQYLFKLKIDECDQLKFILPTSISRGLSCLRHLEVSYCGELERIIEDDDDEECCFPNLHRIIVYDCERLKCLFSISTHGSFPQLSFLRISNAPMLEQVFGGKQGATQELHVKHVFPRLFVIGLDELPKLHTICPAIDFQTVICRYVEDCPNLSLTSTDNVHFIGSYMNWSQKSESTKGNMDEGDLFEQLINVSTKIKWVNLRKEKAGGDRTMNDAYTKLK
ncbi:probable disease resistance protein At4g27220 [Neltuma alba]|uniref:probable disease resistance protein At4g27220 n=1 Tax=Neltuma alba TaxID=207710 RepID=UPI0010A44626|nr:probable disease resistance protein At4g27220 [Prosopis alba]